MKEGESEAAISAAPSNRVREARENRLMTQAELARRANVGLRTIHSVEKGMNCQAATKLKILGALALPFEERHRIFPPGAPVQVRTRARDRSASSPVMPVANSAAAHAKASPSRA